MAQGPICQSTTGRTWLNFLDEDFYRELQATAKFLTQQETSNYKGQGEDLLHEVLLSLMRSSHDMKCNDRAHFRAIVYRAMRRVLIDASRNRKAIKRGNELTFVPLGEDAPGFQDTFCQVIAIDQAIKRLSIRKQRLARVMRKRVVEAASLDEIAADLSISVRTVKRDLKVAREWLCADLAIEQQVA